MTKMQNVHRKLTTSEWKASWARRNSFGLCRAKIPRSKLHNILGLKIKSVEIVYDYHGNERNIWLKWVLKHWRLIYRIFHTAACLVSIQRHEPSIYYDAFHNRIEANHWNFWGYDVFWKSEDQILGPKTGMNFIRTPNLPMKKECWECKWVQRKLFP